MRITVADSGGESRSLLAAALRRGACKVDTAGNFGNGCPALARCDYDLLIALYGAGDDSRPALWRDVWAEVSTLIVGESGSSEELVARALHARSRRCAATWLAVNYAPNPHGLLEAELHGHMLGLEKRGASG